MSLVGDYFGFGTLNITLTGELNGTSWSKIVIVEGFQTTNPEKLFNLSSEGFYPTTLGDALGTKSLPLVGEETDKLKTEKSIPDNITNYGELKNYISIHNQDVNSSTKVYVSQITNDIQNINLGVLGSFEYNTKTNALTYSYFQINTISQLSEYFQDLKSILPKELFELKNPQDLYIWFSKPNGINTLIGGDGVGPDYLTNKIHQYIYLSIKYSTFRAGALIGTYNTNTGSWTWTYSPLYTQLNPNILPGVHIGPNGLPTTISNFGELAEYLNLSVFTQPFAEFYIKKDFKLVVDAVKNNTQWITVQTQELKLNLGEGKSQVFPVPIPVSIEGKIANGTWTYTIISTEKS